MWTILYMVKSIISRYYYDIYVLLEQMWTFKTSGAVFSSPCLHRWRSTTRPIRHTSGQQTHITTEYSLVFGCHDNSIYCVNCQGELKWSFKVDCPVYATPFLHTCLRDGTDTYSERKGLVIVCTTRGRLCALDAHSGGLLCEVALPGDVFSSPVIADNSVVIGCRNNYIYRFRFKRWQKENHLRCWFFLLVQGCSRKPCPGNKVTMYRSKMDLCNIKDIYLIVVV